MNGARVEVNAQNQQDIPLLRERSARTHVVGPLENVSRDDSGNAANRCHTV
jgi:hypothetical protein